VGAGTGRRVSLDECSWLRGPVGDVDVIGTDFFARLADREGLTMVEGGPPRGLVEDFEDLAGPACDPLRVDAPDAAKGRLTSGRAGRQTPVYFRGGSLSI
jgi:hypothetical protein